MNKKFTIFMGILLLGVSLATFGISQARGANTPDAWYGTWRMGPNLDTTILGCPAGNGLARYTGIYYPTQDRVYFLGGRCENNTTTTGSVFYFDPVTLTYTATGAAMPVPVSNYQMVELNDGLGHGTGFYIVGGRTGAGGQTNAVQVYYPDDNTVATITTDPFPPAVSYSPGGVVSQGNKIYVIGGFDGTIMYNSTYVYDPAAPAGARWTLTACNLPTARSYIGAVAVNNLVYAIGGDEYIGATLTPIIDTVVLDPANLGACWQDNLMADLPQANGDAPAVYVDENYIGGGIFMIGGNFAGPNRWVFRYDLGSDIWETFPDLAIPTPATGRRNQAAVYIPSTSGGVNPYAPALWTFGGYDGSAVNAMTETSEFFYNPTSPLLLYPDVPQVIGSPGDQVSDNLSLANLSNIADSYDLSYTSDVTWTVGLPASVGPIQPGAQVTFPMTINIPPSADFCSLGSFEVTATSQSNPGYTASANLSVKVICTVSGIITDQNTGLPIVNAYVWIQNDPNGVVGNYKDAYTDATGHYTMSNVLPGFYYGGADAKGYQPSFFPDGWPDGAYTFNLVDVPVVMSFSLVGSDVAWDPPAISVDVLARQTINSTLAITNTGSGPYYGNVSIVDSSQPLPPQIGTLAVPGLPKLDQQILSDINDSPDGTTDFVVVLNSQADLTSASAISDWSARGWAVYNTLSQFAATHQLGLRSYLTSQGVNYTPLYIINGVIVHAGNTALVNTLAARPDVAQLVANHQIAVEKQLPAPQLSTMNAPDTIEWNILKIKANQVWTTYSDKGEGMVVAEIDTGTQWDHPALKNHYRGWNGVSADHNYNWYDPYFQCPSNGTIPCDPGAHGTHVMGTMVGDDGGANQIGVAPGAKWITCKGGDAVSGYLLTNQLLTCAQWILAPWDLNGQNPNPDKRPNVVNNSWGGGPNDYWYTGAVSAWRAAGIFPAFANGNAGPNCSTAHSPGDNWNSFASGASTNTDTIAGFSSRGPAAYTGFLKPNIMAPGASIRSSVPTNGYAIYNGTSMASPHTAAAVALLWSAAPDLKGQIDLTAWVLEQTAAHLTDHGSNCGGDYVNGPNNDWGYGRLDIFAAVTKAKTEKITPGWLAVSPQGITVLPDASGSFNLTFKAPAKAGTYTATLLLVGDDPYHSEIRIPLTMNVAGRVFLPFAMK